MSTAAKKSPASRRRAAHPRILRLPANQLGVRVPQGTRVIWSFPAASCRAGRPRFWSFALS